MGGQEAGQEIAEAGYLWVSSALSGETRSCLTSEGFDVLLSLLASRAMEAGTIAGLISLILLLVCLQLVHLPDVGVTLDIYPCLKLEVFYHI